MHNDLLILADLHIHSTFSDGKLTIPELVDFYGSRGFGCIAITDHICERHNLWGRTAHALSYTLTLSNFPFYMEIIKSESKRAWEQYQMLVIPGFELSKNSFSNHRSAHILGLGVSEFISADLGITEQLEALKAQKALTIAAHPVSTRQVEKQTFHLWDRREELAPLFDAWEVASGAHLFEEVQQSGLPMIANSDLHKPSQITSWKTLIDADPTQASIFQAIREQRLKFYFYKEEQKDAGYNRTGHFDSLAHSHLSAP